uniref:Uncharacterized protein n=1 Tax=Strombidium rassoulzadegani TaxID=1082188 RepID=A0A7S3FVJ1_9SPIT|mmetsp:Transcript_2657/g.4454  ORF Transcript_2657/g.4454 Transcript_2657/m.4454 type:complete len:267 (+) Transcript_2657:827-1627(+)
MYAAELAQSGVDPSTIVSEAEAEGSQEEKQVISQLKKKKLELELGEAEDLARIYDLEEHIREVNERVRKEMNDYQLRMFLRATVLFKREGVFESRDSVDVYGEDYTGNHIAIFECEVKTPRQMILIDHTYPEYLEALRINFRDWKLVDVDNFFKGNPFFERFMDQQVWEKDVKDVLGTDKAEVYGDETKHFMQTTFLPEMRDFAEYIDSTQDTRGNRLMSPLHRRRQQLQALLKEEEPLEDPFHGSEVEITQADGKEVELEAPKIS